jgi:hypothetical protein
LHSVFCVGFSVSSGKKPSVVFRMFVSLAYWKRLLPMDFISSTPVKVELTALSSVNHCLRLLASL